MSTLHRAWPFTLACIVFFATSHVCFADDAPVVHSSTDVSPDSRYQLVESPLLARFMLRVDRFTGEVAQINVDTKSSEYFWASVKMDKFATKNFHIYTDNRVHFQVFLSGILAKHMFLMDVDTGQTWVLTKDQKDQQWWENVD